MINYTNDDKRTSSLTAVSQAIVLGTLAALIASFVCHQFLRIIFPKSESPFWMVLSIVSILTVIIVFVVLAIKGNRKWSNLYMFTVIIGILSFGCVILAIGANVKVRMEHGNTDINSSFLASVKSYISSATICLDLFEKVNDKPSAEQAVEPLTLELASLGGTVRSFAEYQDSKEVSDLVKTAEQQMQDLTQRLKVAILKAQRQAGETTSFHEISERYLQLVKKIERKEHLKPQ